MTTTSSPVGPGVGVGSELDGAVDGTGVGSEVAVVKVI